MFDLNELTVVAYENASRREAKDGAVSTDTIQMLKHTATEVVEATEAYNNYIFKTGSAVGTAEERAKFASELADIVCCVLIIAGKEGLNMEKALTCCMEKNYYRSVGKGDK